MLSDLRKSQYLLLEQSKLRSPYNFIGILTSGWDPVVVIQLEGLRILRTVHSACCSAVVKDGKVIIVDEFTGRMMPGRRWSDGLHQAVEAREGIKIERENQTLATITFQNYFRMYGKLAGMTGTAYTEANEFKQIYNLDTVVIPTNRQLIRVNYPDCIYKTAAGKIQCCRRGDRRLPSKRPAGFSGHHFDRKV